MKLLSILYIFYCLPHISFSQAPDITWQNTIGGAGNDEIQSIHQTIDGGYILGGYSNSDISGDKTEDSKGGYDYWIVKLNSFGSIIWQKTIGGNANDILMDLQLSTDGGYILGGYSNSDISGDKTEANIAGSNDYWVVKTNALGNIEWQNTIGGAGNDEFHSLAQTSDGGYILGGRSNSSVSGDKTEASDGYYDYWVVKIDHLGTIEWDNTFSGNEYDYLYSVCAVGNDILVGGYSNSPISGDKTVAPHNGSGDYWVLLLDSIGNIVWQKAIGGNDADFLFNIKLANDGSVYLHGYSDSDISGDKTETNQGFYDYWTVEIDSVGNIIWQKSIGGSSEDISKTKHANDSYLLAGNSQSGATGDKTEPNIGLEDYWVVNLDSIGNIQWQKTIGGWLGDFLKSIDQTIDEGYILGGYSSSPMSGDKTENPIGSNDYWIIKLAGTCTNNVFYADDDNDGFGGDSDSVLTCLAPIGYADNKSDCNDTNAGIHPSADEICNAVDDNCNSETDEGLPHFTLFADNDGDAFGNALLDSTSCMTELTGYVADSTDCDDENNLIHEPILYFADIDFDNFGDAGNAEFFCSLTSPTGYVVDSSDCDDTNSLIHTPLLYYADNDGDLYGDISNKGSFCSNVPPSGFVTDSTDCDDTNSAVYPGALELQNDIDDNCNDTIDEQYSEILEIESFEFAIYPNPNFGDFEIRIETASLENLLIEIFNLYGEMIYCKQSEFEEVFEIHLPWSFSGIAIVKIEIGKVSVCNLINIIKY